MRHIWSIHHDIQENTHKIHTHTNNRRQGWNTKYKFNAKASSSLESSECLMFMLMLRFVYILWFIITNYGKCILTRQILKYRCCDSKSDESSTARIKQHISISISNTYTESINEYVISLEKMWSRHFNRFPSSFPWIEHLTGNRIKG